MIPNNSPAAPQCVLSIDVEDWFHFLDLPSAPPLNSWHTLPSRVERNFLRLLALAGDSGVRCTCFFVGWIAKRFPSLVLLAEELGHEIASHGWSHSLAYQLTPKQFYEDALRAKDVLENISGKPVYGYRSAGFSFTDSNTWVFDELLRAGYVYDCSVFPAARAHGGWRNGLYSPHIIERPEGQLVEFPMTVNEVFGTPVCFFGGGYLRLFPLAVIQRMSRKVLGQGRPVIFYVHPREVDPAQPRLEMSRWRRFKSYVNLETTEAKLQAILQKFQFTTFEHMMEDVAPGLLPMESRWKKAV